MLLRSKGFEESSEKTVITFTRNPHSTLDFISYYYVKLTLSNISFIEKSIQIPIRLNRVYIEFKWILNDTNGEFFYWSKNVECYKD